MAPTRLAQLTTFSSSTAPIGLVSGLNVLHMINMLTAAAVTYGLDKKVLGLCNFLIFDLGGASFNVYLLTINEGHGWHVMTPIWEVRTLITISPLPAVPSSTTLMV